MLLQVDLSKWESALGPGQIGAGPSLHATPSAPLPCHRPGPGGESIIAAGFPYTPDEWSSASATALACVDDGCGNSMAHCHQAHQPATNLTGLACGFVYMLAVSHAQGSGHRAQSFPCIHSSSLGVSCAWLMQSVKGTISSAVIALQTASVVFETLLIQVCIMLQLVG